MAAETMPPADYEKPCIPANADGNIFALIGLAGAVMKQAGHGALRDEMRRRVSKCMSYDEALQELMRWVDFA